ncbi:MAG TPA: hypothetical protein VF164_09505 [Trueperaceae bacterium]
MIASLCFDPLDLYLAIRSDPGLARVPLVSAQEQRVTHANAPARRHGITPGMRLDGARMRVEGLEVVSHTEPDLQHAWEELLRELNQHTPWVEGAARGRALVRLGDVEAEELAARYGVRVGLAHDRETAELAAVSSRPGTVRRVDDVKGFLARLPLRFLRRVGLSEANLTRLTWLGLYSAAHLASWTASQISSYLAAEGDALLPYLHGPRHTDLRPFEPAPTVARSLTFEDPVVEPHRILPALDRLAGELARELGGRTTRRLTLTASLPGGTRRASRLSKRPLTQARHIRQQALFALEDSHAYGQPIERLTLELASPERLGEQEGLWPVRERRQRALEATLERFPTAQRRLEWEDTHSQATDLVWRWQGYADEDGAYANASVVNRRVGNTAQARSMTKAPLTPAAVSAAVPLFDGTTEGAPLARGDAAQQFPSAGIPAAPQPADATGAAASYLDALFTGAEGAGAHLDTEDAHVSAGATSHADSADRAEPSGRSSLPNGPRQRYTEEYGLEAA